MFSRQVFGNAISVGVIAVFLTAARAQASAPGADAHARELARALVSAEGGKARISKYSALMTPVLTERIESTLGVTDPAKKERIGTLVQNDVQGFFDDVIELSIEILAQTYSPQELEGMLAFNRSPTGQAYRQLAPALSREITAAITSSTPGAAESPLSENKRALIDRVLRAQDIDGSTRRGLRVLGSTVAVGMSQIGGDPSPSHPEAHGSADEDAYVKVVMAAETRFYANNFSEAQLTDLAEYFEGPIAKSVRGHRKEIMTSASGELPKIVDRRFGDMEEGACAVVVCTASQRASLDRAFSIVRTMAAQYMTESAR